MSTIDDLPAYDDEDGIQLMDNDANNLQPDDHVEMASEASSIQTRTKRVPITFDPIDDSQIEKDRKRYRNKNQFDQKKSKDSGKTLIFDKVKLYIRDGPKSHHVETHSINQTFYDLPTSEQLSTSDLTVDQIKTMWESLNLTEENFRVNSSSTGNYRPESLYVHGVHHMNTQQIFDLFEEFEPTGIEWISDNSCRIFWTETLSPLRVLIKISTSVPSTILQQETENGQNLNSRKRKFNQVTANDNQPSKVPDISSGHWRTIEFLADDHEEKKIVLYVRYSTTEDRKIIGSQHQSEYYRQNGNPNYDNMKGLISRSKRLELNRLKKNNLWNYTVVKTNLENSTSISDVVDDVPIEDDQTDTNVKFTVILPPKKSESTEENQQTEDDDEEPNAKRRKHHRTSEDSFHDEEDDQQKQSEKTHFTVTIDPKSSITKDILNRSLDSSTATNQHSSLKKKSGKNEDQKSVMLDAREIIQQKRRKQI